jgi:hypothetical protein
MRIAGRAAAMIAVLALTAGCGDGSSSGSSANISHDSIAKKIGCTKVEKLDSELWKCTKEQDAITIFISHAPADQLGAAARAADAFGQAYACTGTDMLWCIYGTYIGAEAAALGWKVRN